MPGPDEVKRTDSGLEQSMAAEAQRIATEEERRYNAGLGGLTNAYNESRQALSSLIDPELLFSRASDAIGARSRSALEGMRRSLGARGLNANSGAAQGMLSRLIFEQQGALTGARRDIAIENQRQRMVNAGVLFNQALGLAQYTNSPVSGIVYEDMQNRFEGELAREGIRAYSEAQASANETNLWGSIFGAAGNVLGGIL